jgi:hypothetical protein
VDTRIWEKKGWWQGKERGKTKEGSCKLGGDEMEMRDSDIYTRWMLATFHDLKAFLHGKFFYDW